MIKKTVRQTQELLRKQRNAKRVLVTGDRRWTDRRVIFRELAMCHKMKTLIHGKCSTGADAIADAIGRAVLGGEHVDTYPADWGKHKRAAGPIRNRQMITEGKPNFVLAFHSDLANSKGTRDMVLAARKAGIVVKVVTE